MPRSRILAIQYGKCMMVSIRSYQSFSRWLYHIFISSSKYMRVPFVLQVLFPPLCIVSLFNFSHFGGWVVVSYYGFYVHFSDIEHIVLSNYLLWWGVCPSLQSIFKNCLPLFYSIIGVLYMSYLQVLCLLYTELWTVFSSP